MPQLPDDTLKDIQGFITSGYQHLPVSAYLLLQFRDEEKSKSWLEEVLPTIMTSEKWRVVKGRKIKPPGAVNLAFTFAGLRQFSLAQDTLNSFPAEFIDGMASRAAVIGDKGNSSPCHWEFGGVDCEGRRDPKKEIHALVIINAADEDQRERLVTLQRELIDDADGGVVELSYQCGSRPPSEKNPLGFRDGISNPLIEGTKGHDVPDHWVVRTGCFILGYLNGYEQYPESPTVQVPQNMPDDDPVRILPIFPENKLPGCRDFGRNGSYLVYRKLETDVAAFWRYLQSNAACPFASATETQKEMIMLASKFVGRWPSGTPLVLSPERDTPGLWKNNEFTYESDTQGLACPIGSHIRRANPRDAIARNTPEDGFRTSNNHRILRRASYYGDVDGGSTDKPLFDFDMLASGQVPLDLEDDGVRRGLHFCAVQADIVNQFEFTQELWCNFRHFNGVFDNKDPIIGDNDHGEPTHMTIPRRPVRRRVPNLPRIVETRGGDYFFLPSMTAMRYLHRC